jgi:BirA family biotin operon repressor/biotin-[acetyl-CoA-carboxylase] ligase
MFNTNRFEELSPTWGMLLQYFPSIGSTNVAAREQLRQNPLELLLVADEQTAGKGRLGRKWQAQAGSALLCTITTKLELPLDKAYLYTVALALSVVKAGEKLSGIKLDLKYPNDLIRDGKKFGGILTEVEAGLGAKRTETWLALGFGINLSLSSQDFEIAGIADKATNITPPNLPVLSRENLLAESLLNFDHYRHQLKNPAYAENLRQEWAERLITLGKTVNIYQIDRLILTGFAQAIAEDGSLLVEDESGKIHKINAGDVSVRLPDGRYA